MSKKEKLLSFIVIIIAFVGVLIAREHSLISIACFAPLVFLIWRKYRQCKRLEIIGELESLEWREFSTSAINWCEVLRIAENAKKEWWRTLTTKELIDAMWHYPSKFRKGSYWSSEGLTVSFPERKILKENPVRNASLYLVRVKRGR
ncbi:MAG: hypothetical protein WCO12_02945 [bacterium]